MKKVNKFFYIIHFILLAVPLIIFIIYYILVANIYFNGKKEVDFVHFEMPEIVKQRDLQVFEAYNSETGQKLYYYDSNKDADIYYNIIDESYDITFKKTNERFIYDNYIVKYFVSENDVKSIEFGEYDSDIFEIDFKNQLLFEAENDNKYPGLEILYYNEINDSNCENLYGQFYDYKGDLYYKDKHLLTYTYCIIFEGIGYYDFTIMSIIIPIIFAVYILLLSFYILRFKKINKQCKSGEIKPKIFNLFILLDILILSMPIIQFLIIMIMSHDNVGNHMKSFGGIGLEIGVFDFIVFLILSIISIVVAKKSIKDKPIKDVVTKENKSNTDNTEVVQNDETAVDNYENLNGTYELTEEAYVQSVFENLKFEDSIVHSKDWKAFKKYASLDDLFVIAIGSKYRSSSTGALIKKIISVVGTILSIVIGLVILFNGSGNLGVAGVAIAIVGYFFFNLLAIKQIGYAETLRQCLWKLPKEDRKFVNRLWNNTFVEILNIILELLLNFMVIPYKFIIIVLTTFIPKLENWGIAKGLNSSVITLPVGYDISSLSSLSEYYRSTKFGETVSNYIEEKYEAKQEELKRDAETVKAYTIKDADGNSIRVYTKDRHTFYRDEACAVNSIGKSYDNGKTINIE